MAGVGINCDIPFPAVQTLLTELVANHTFAQMTDRSTKTRDVFLCS